MQSTSAFAIGLVCRRARTDCPESLVGLVSHLFATFEPHAGTSCSPSRLHEAPRYCLTGFENMHIMNQSHSRAAVRLAATTIKSGSQGINHGSSGVHVSSKGYNPYRPDPPEIPKEPRRVIMKNLKFGRLAQAASAGVEGARRSLVESTTQTSAVDGNPYHSSSRSSSIPSASPPASSASKPSYGNSANASYKNGRSTSSGLWILAGAGVAGAAAAYTVVGKTAISAQSSSDASTSNAVGNFALLLWEGWRNDKLRADASS